MTHETNLIGNAHMGAGLRRPDHNPGGAGCGSSTRAAGSDRPTEELVTPSPAVGRAGRKAGPGLLDGINNHRSSPWTPLQRQEFRRLWSDPNFSRDEIATKIGRSLDACSAQAQVMGMKRPKKPKPPPKPVKIDVRRVGPEAAEGSRADAENCAANIRAYWSRQGKSVRVEVVYVPGIEGHLGSWSARIMDTVAVPAAPKRRGAAGLNPGWLRS